MTGTIVAITVLAGCTSAGGGNSAPSSADQVTTVDSALPGTSSTGGSTAAGSDRSQADPTPAVAGGQQSTNNDESLATAGPSFITTVSADGHFFLDQFGRPYLVHGDSPWSMAIDISNADADWYFQQRAKQGFNSVLLSAFGGEGTGGGDSENFTTFDGVAPFVDGDLTQYNEPYWQRLDGKIALAEKYGFTVFLYVMDTFGENGTFAEWDNDHTPEHDYRVAKDYCSFVAKRYQDSPNVVYMLGGDYDNYIPTLYAGGMDTMMKGCADSIKTAAPEKLLSIQLTGFPQSNSFDYPGWTTRPDFSFVYSYNPSYDATLQGYNHTWAATPTTRPALYMEGPYEGENNKGWPNGAPPLTLRHQMLWAILSGSPGDFYGRGGVWQFDPGWQEKVLDTGVTAQLGKLTTFLASTDWYQLVPDQQNAFVTAGNGTPNSQGGNGLGTSNENVNPETDGYATAALTPAGSLGMVYVPTARTITVDRSKIPQLSKSVWIDPTDASAEPIPAVFSGNDVTTPGVHESDLDGAGNPTSDWLLVMK